MIPLANIERELRRLAQPSPAFISNRKTPIPYQLCILAVFGLEERGADLDWAESDRRDAHRIVVAWTGRSSVADEELVDEDAECGTFSRCRGLVWDKTCFGVDR
jgi:hypothetical protein